MFRDDELVFRDEWFLEALALENEGGASGVQVWPRPLRTMQALFRTSWVYMEYVWHMCGIGIEYVWHMCTHTHVPYIVAGKGPMANISAFAYRIAPEGMHEKEPP